MENVSGPVLSMIHVFKTSKLVTSSGGQQTNLVQYSKVLVVCEAPSYEIFKCNLICSLLLPYYLIRELNI